MAPPRRDDCDAPERVEAVFERHTALAATDSFSTSSEDAALLGRALRERRVARRDEPVLVWASNTVGTS